MHRTVFVIIGLAAAGQAISYALAILLARRLGVAGFEAYAVASAVFILMVAVAPCGIDKYAIRVVPALLVRNDWSAALGFLKFGARRILLTAIALSVAVGAGVWWWDGIPSATRIAIIVSCLALPAGALAHFGLEVLAASGREILAATILRVAVPVVVLAVVGLLLATLSEVTGAMAIAAWTTAWIVSLPALFITIRRAMPPTVWIAEATEQASTWSGEASLFWGHRTAMALTAQSGVIALELLQPSAVAVGAYAAALATTAPALVLVTATNRVFARRLSIHLEKRDMAALSELQRVRLRWVVPTVLAFLFVCVVFAEPIMGLFGPAFVEDGVTPMRLLATATAFSMVFALSPTYLKHTRQRGVTLWTAMAAAAAQLVLLWALVPGLGATGAALAFTMSTVGLYGAFALFTWLDLNRLKAERLRS